jgi:hypothetical protein
MLIVTGINLYLVWQNYELSNRNLQLQNMIYNYPPRIFAHPSDQYDLLCNLNHPEPSGMMHLFVVIVTPHNGYALVNQTFFQLSNDAYTKDVLNPNVLKSDNVSIYRSPVFAVGAGSFQTTLEIGFFCLVTLAFQYIQPGRAVEAPIGTVGIRVTFYDVQTNSTYTTNTTAMVWIRYDTTGLLSNSS